MSEDVFYSKSRRGAPYEGRKEYRIPIWWNAKRYDFHIWSCIKPVILILRKLRQIKNFIKIFAFYYYFLESKILPTKWRYYRLKFEKCKVQNIVIFLRSISLLEPDYAIVHATPQFTFWHKSIQASLRSTFLHSLNTHPNFSIFS